MRTRIHQWLSINPRGRGTRIEVRYGIQVYHRHIWMHAHRNGNPLIYKTKERAEAQRKVLRKAK